MRREVASEEATAAQAKAAGCDRKSCQVFRAALQLCWSPGVRHIQAPWQGRSWEAAVEGTAPWTEPGQLVSAVLEHSLVCHDPCRAMEWSLPVEKELSSEGWAENPPNCVVGNHMQQRLLWPSVCLPPREDLVFNKYLWNSAESYPLRAPDWHSRES